MKNFFQKRNFSRFEFPNHQFILYHFTVITPQSLNFSRIIPYFPQSLKMFPTLSYTFTNSGTTSNSWKTTNLQLLQQNVDTYIFEFTTSLQKKSKKKGEPFVPFMKVIKLIIAELMNRCSNISAKT